MKIDSQVLEIITYRLNSYDEHEWLGSVNDTEIIIVSYDERGIKINMSRCLPVRGLEEIESTIHVMQRCVQLAKAHINKAKRAL